MRHVGVYSLIGIKTPNPSPSPYLEETPTPLIKSRISVTLFG